MRYLKQKANETSSCAQDAHQKKFPRNDDLLYYTEFPKKHAMHVILQWTVVILE